MKRFIIIAAFLAISGCDGVSIGKNGSAPFYPGSDSCQCMASPPPIAATPSGTNVEDFGANGSDLLDDTAAINAAFASANTLAQSISGTESGSQGYLGSSTSATIFLPAGKYILSGPIGSGSNNVHVRGERALLVSTNRDIDLLSLGTVNILVEGLIFDGGKTHIRFGGPRVEAGFMVVRDCQFRNAKVRCIDMDRSEIMSSGWPANLRIHDCKSYGSGFLRSYCNGTTVSDCWLAWDTSGTSWDGGPLLIANDNLRLQNLAEVPFGVNAQRYPRIQDAIGYPGDDHLAVTAYGCRFGGEATTTPIMHIQSEYSSLLLDGCAIFGVADSYWLRCDAVPERVTVRHPTGGPSTGFVNSWGIWFNSSLTAADVPALARLDLDLGTVYVNAARAIQSGNFLVNGGPRCDLIARQGSTVPVQLANYDIGNGLEFWSSPYTTDGYLAGFGGGTTLLGHTGAGLVTFSGEGYYAIRFPGFTPGVAGTVSFSCWVNATSRSAWYMYGNVGGALSATGILEPGMNHVTTCFYHDGAGTTTPSIGITGRLGDAHAIGLFTFNRGGSAGEWQHP